MRYIQDKNEIKKAKKYMELAAEEAKKSTCKKSQRGALIVKRDVILSRGHNKVTLRGYCFEH